MNTQVTILLILAAALFGLAIWMLTRYQRGQATLYYGVFLLSLAGLAVAQAMFFQASTDSSALLWTKLGYVFGVMTFPALLVFTFFFPVPSANTPRHHAWFFWVPVLVFGTLILTSTMFLESVHIETNGTQEQTGVLYWVFPALAGVYVVWAIRNLLQKLVQSQGIQQRSLRSFIWVLIITSLIGLISDVLLPALGQTRVPVGIYSSGILFGLSTYIVTRKS